MKDTAPAISVAVLPAPPDKGDNERFARLCHLLMHFRRQDEAAGHRYLDEQGKPIQPLGQEDKP